MPWIHDSPEVKITNTSEIAKFSIEGLVFLPPFPTGMTEEELAAYMQEKMANLSFQVEVWHGYREEFDDPILDDAGQPVLDENGVPTTRTKIRFTPQRITNHTLDKDLAVSIMMQPVPSGLSYYDAVGEALYRVLRLQGLIPEGAIT